MNRKTSSETRHTRLVSISTESTMAEFGGVVSDDEEFDVNVGRRAVNEEGLLPEATPPPAIEKVVTDVSLPYRLKVIARILGCK